MITQYIAELRKLSVTVHCDFKQYLDEAPLRDRLVCGIQSEATQKRLLAVDNLTIANPRNLLWGWPKLPMK